VTVAFDAATTTLLLWEKADAPLDPSTGKPVERAKERVDQLVRKLHQSKTRIIIPTPALAEILVQSGAAGLRYVQRLEKAAAFDIRPFDTLAAIELAEMTRQAIATGDKRLGESAPYQKIKTDRQIVAIARVAGARVLYSDDGPLARFATQVGLHVVKLHHLPIPADATEPLQMDDMFAQRPTGAEESDQMEIVGDAEDLAESLAEETDVQDRTAPPL
jgi:predicted nucleic acid-binding protein